MKHVTSNELWPPPENWTEIVVLWNDVLHEPKFPIKKMLDWLEETEGGNYHVHGYESTKGFSFRFQNPEDATHFKLRWL